MLGYYSFKHRSAQFSSASQRMSRIEQRCILPLRRILLCCVIRNKLWKINNWPCDDYLEPYYIRLDSFGILQCADNERFPEGGGGYCLHLQSWAGSSSLFISAIAQTSDVDCNVTKPTYAEELGVCFWDSGDCVGTDCGWWMRIIGQALPFAIRNVWPKMYLNKGS